MSNRLKFLAVGLLGVAMSCTLITAPAADYRKSKTEKYVTASEVSTLSVTMAYEPFYAFDLANSDLTIVYSPKVTYLLPVNQPKVNNKNINALINDRREQERISTGQMI